MNKSKIEDYLFHAIAYDVSWFSAIFLAAHHQNLFAFLVVTIIAVAQVIWQYTLAKRTKGLWLMVALFVVFGTLADTLMMKINLIAFSANPFHGYISPPWMSALWFSFAITFYSTLPSLFKRYLLTSILSFVSFPLAYAAGAALRAADFPHGYMSAISIGIIWAILFPFILIICNCLQGKASK